MLAYVVASSGLLDSRYRASTYDISHLPLISKKFTTTQAGRRLRSEGWSFMNGAWRTAGRGKNLGTGAAEEVTAGTAREVP